MEVLAGNDFALRGSSLTASEGLSVYAAPKVRVTREMAEERPDLEPYVDKELTVIEATNIQDAPANIQRTVTENAHTLHFSSFGFEDE